MLAMSIRSEGFARMAVHPSGFYAWCTEPESQRALEDRRLLGHIKQSWLESGAVYGYRKVSDDLRDLGEQCGINRRPMK
jgi:putative transposase